MPIEITFSMDRKAHFSANLAVLYRPWKHVLILVGALWAVFFVLFGADTAINGTDGTTAAMWQIMSSLLYLSAVLTGAAAFYFAYAPLQAYLSASSKCRRDPTATRPRVLRFDKKRVSLTDADGASVLYEWTDLKPWRKTAAFWILRDRSKKGQLIVPRRGYREGTEEGMTDGEIAAALAYREQMICKKNPVAAERARQSALRAGSNRTDADANTALRAPDAEGAREDTDEEKETVPDDDSQSDGR